MSSRRRPGPRRVIVRNTAATWTPGNDSRLATRRLISSGCSRRPSPHDIMRIAIVSRFHLEIGGTEAYIGLALEALVRAGHTVAFWHETSLAGAAKPIPLPPGVPLLNSRHGPSASIDTLRSWKPDIIYCHGLTHPQTEAEMLGVAPSVLFVHDYYGTCISGSKSFAWPVARPCTRRFGWQCLLQYFPRRCGGLSPMTMVTDFRTQAKRLAQLSRYGAIVTASQHMWSEFLNHGLASHRVRHVRYTFIERQVRAPRRRVSASVSHRLVFIGRMERLKGGRLLLDALPSIASSLGARVEVVFVGTGSQRPQWELYGTQVAAQDPRIDVKFVGWSGREEMESLLAEQDLLVVPSVWPEPFGLVGIEAAQLGVPAVGFAVGGISEWLTDGINGRLAPADPPTARGLAETIVRCLSDPADYARLKHGAVARAGDFAVSAHLADLIPILESVAGRSRTGSSRTSGR